MKKSFLSILLALCTLICLMPVGISAEEPAAAEPTTAQELLDAAADTATDIIRLAADITLSKTLRIEHDLTLDLNGRVLTVTGNISVISIAKGKTLTLIDSVPEAEHRFRESGERRNMWIPDPNGDKLVHGGVITGGRSVMFGGGVYIHKDATLIMKAGNIIGNDSEMDGGGVAAEGGTFIMEGGRIAGCRADSYGGSVYVTEGTFIMRGGRIEECTTPPRSDGYASAVYMFDSVMYACGGTIDDKCGMYGDCRVTGGDTESGITAFLKQVTCDDDDNILLEHGMFYGGIPEYAAADCTVTYMYNEAVYAVQALKSGKTASAPERPGSAGTGYTVAWCGESGGEYDFAHPATESITLAGKRTVCSHTEITNKPTCTGAAECTVCGGEIPAKQHTPGKDWVIENGKKVKKCTECGAAAETAPRSPGDIDGDGEITALDCLYLKRWILGTFGGGIVLENADVDGNGSINAADYLYVKRAYLGTFDLSKLA